MSILNKSIKRKNFPIYILLFLIVYFYNTNPKSYNDANNQSAQLKISNPRLTNKYNRLSSSPLLFIGGHENSGSLLLKSILNIHPNINCSSSIDVLPKLLEFIRKFKFDKDGKAFREFNDAGFDFSLVDSSAVLFIHNLLNTRFRNDFISCAHDSDTFYYLQALHKLFPNSKFIYMVRDGRQASFSQLKQKGSNQTFEKFSSYLRDWQNYNSRVKYPCSREEHCKIVRYEDLIARTEETMTDLSSFLNVSWVEGFSNRSRWPVYELDVGLEQISKEVSGYDPVVVNNIAFFLPVFGYNVSISNSSTSKSN